jgi:hypothetical protein
MEAKVEERRKREKKGNVHVFRNITAHIQYSTNTTPRVRLVSSSLTFAARRTTFRPVRWIFSHNWSTAMLLGAATRTCPCFCIARWYTTDADVTVFPVPGGPWKRRQSETTECSTVRV